MSRFEYLRPKDLDNALKILREDGIYPIAGGTNLLVDIRAGIVQPKAVLDIGFLQELKELNHGNGLTEIGPCLTMTEVANSALIRSKAPILAQAALSVGGPQIRNRATLGGNIVSASPAADTVVALVSLGATVLLQSTKGVRKVLLEDLFVGPSQTKIERDELLTRIFFEAPSSNERGFFYKLGRRNALAVAVVNLGILAKIDETTQKWESVRIVLGSVAPTVMRAKKAEALLSNQFVDENLIREAAKTAASECSPISDIRSSADYRRSMVEGLVERGLAGLVGVAR
jgi:CO/xanthine dehydrogenase FAD-binding subunit